MSFTKEQFEIINNKDQHLVCIASAGTGKSTTIVEKVVRIIKSKELKPDRIMMTSFSRNANSELIYKLKGHLSSEVVDSMSISTIHALAYKICLEGISYLPVDKIKIKSVNYLAGFYFNISNSMGRELTKSEAKKDVNLFLSELMDKEPKIFDYDTRNMLSMAMDDFHEKGFICYDELLIYARDILEQNKFNLKDKYSSLFDLICIDEFQDTNKIQIDIASHLVSENTRTVVVGDIKQMIYGFRGANISNSEDWIKTYNPTILYLSETFRFGQKVADLSNTIIDRMDISETFKIKTQTNVSLDKDIVYEVSKEVKDVCDEIENNISKGFELGDVNVLARTNNELLEFDKELKIRNIPCHLAKGGLLERKEIKFLIAFLDVIDNSHEIDLDSLLFITKEFNNMINEKSIIAVYHSLEKEDRNIEKLLEKGIFKDVKGIGKTRREGFKKLKDKIDSLFQMFSDTKDDYNSIFQKIASAVNIEEARFMDMEIETEEGIPLYIERLQYIEYLDELFRKFFLNNEKGLNESLKDYILRFLEVLKVDYMADNGNEGEINKVRLRTIHNTKGCSLPIVHFILDKVYMFSRTPKEVLEETFLLYVACTRPSNTLYMYKNTDKQAYYDFLFPLEKLQEIKPKEKKELFSEKDIKLLTINFNKGSNVWLKEWQPIATTEKAILFRTHKSTDQWIPKSQLAYDQINKDFHVPSWLHKKVY